MMLFEGPYPCEEERMTRRLAIATLTFVLVVLAIPAVAKAQHAPEHGSNPPSSQPAGASVPRNAQKVEIQVTKAGFVPDKVTVKAGTPVALLVTRKVERTCATEIVLKDFGVNQPLPLDKTVTVVVNPKKPGTYRFACGMDMIAGELRVQ